MADFFPGPHMEEGSRDLWDVFLRELITFVETLPSRPKHPPEDPKTSWGGRISIYEFEGGDGGGTQTLRPQHSGIS